MSTPHDRAVREVFDRAARGTEAERTCAMAPAYHHMPEVAREVDELLIFHDSVGTPLDLPAPVVCRLWRTQLPRGLSDT